MSYNHYMDVHHEKCKAETEKWDRITPVSPEDKYEYGYYLFEVLDFCNAVEWFRIAAGEKAMEAYYMLAYCLKNGCGVTADQEEAQEFFKRYIKEIKKRKNSRLTLTAKQQYRLGMCLQYGYGIKKDEEQALDLFTGAAKEIGEASYEIGKAYREGRCNLPKDKACADRYFMQAYYQLYGEAIFESFALFDGMIEEYPHLLELRTGYSYLLGRYMRVVKVNPNQDSFLRLAKMYEKGYPGDSAAGYECFQRKAKKYRAEAIKYKNKD